MGTMANNCCHSWKGNCITNVQNRVFCKWNSFQEGGTCTDSNECKSNWIAFLMFFQQIQQTIFWRREAPYFFWLCHHNRIEEIRSVKQIKKLRHVRADWILPSPELLNKNLSVFLQSPSKVFEWNWNAKSHSYAIWASCRILFFLKTLES